MKLLKLFLIIIVSAQCLFSQQSPIFRITQDGWDYLRYYLYSNVFDSSKVTCLIGEFQLLNSNDRVRINLTDCLDSLPSKCIQGIQNNGIDEQLQALSRTVSFSIPSLGTRSIRFYREYLESYNPCDRFYSNPPDLTGQWDIADRTEFVILLIDLTTGEVLATLDSVGSNPNIDPNTDARYGTASSLVYHSRPLPPSTQNKDVYIRISPRRYGSTDFGLLLKEIDHWVNLSALQDEYGNLIPDSIS